MSPQCFVSVLPLLLQRPLHPSPSAQPLHPQRDHSPPTRDLHRNNVHLPHCPQHSGSACLPAPTLAAIIIAALFVILLIGLSIRHALRARKAALSDEEGLRNDTGGSNTMQVEYSSTASLPSRPSPTIAAYPVNPEWRQHVAAGVELPATHTPRTSGNTLEVPVYGSTPDPRRASQLSSSQHSSTLMASENTDTLPVQQQQIEISSPQQRQQRTPTPLHERPRLQRTRALTGYLHDLEARFTPEGEERTEIEVEGFSRGGDEEAAEAGQGERGGCCACQDL